MGFGREGLSSVSLVFFWLWSSGPPWSAWRERPPWSPRPCCKYTWPLGGIPGLWKGLLRGYGDQPVLSARDWSYPSLSLRVLVEMMALLVLLAPL